MQYTNLTAFRVARRDHSQGNRYQRGMTLIEWMISITIGLVLLAGLTALIAQQSSTQAELEKSSRQIENGRYAMQILNEDVQMAGYYGEFYRVGTLPVPGALPDPCLKTKVGIEPAIPFPLQGYDFPSATTVRPACIDAANHVSGTDILVLRRVEPIALPITQAASASADGQIYLQTGMDGNENFDKKMGTGADAAGTTVFTLYAKDLSTSALLRKFLVHIYFVSPCSVMSNGAACSSSDDGGNPIPTLKRLELSAAGSTTTMTMTPLVEGIENMQIDYGFDLLGGDGAPDSYAKDAPAVANWADVMAVRLHLLARSNERTVGHTDTKTYNLGLNGTTAATNDGFKRRVFSQLVRLVNPSSRRDL